MQMKIKDQSSAGEVLFNIEAGRLYSTLLKQNVTIEATVNARFNKRSTRRLMLR
jgi:hypothetical protein